MTTTHTAHIVSESIAALAVLAQGGTWQGVKSCDRPAGSGIYAWRKGLDRVLMRGQRGTCVQCGERLDETAEFNHIVRRGPKGKGWLAGNIFLGHKACNDLHAHRDLDIHDLARPDLLVMEWPARSLMQSWSR